jgi:hypothetical protein
MKGVRKNKQLSILLFTFRIFGQHRGMIIGPDIEAPDIFRDGLEFLVGFRLRPRPRAEDEDEIAPEWRGFPPAVMKWINDHNARHGSDADVRKRFYPNHRAASKAISDATARQTDRMGITCEL